MRDNKDIARFKRAVKEISRRCKKSKVYARKFLVKVGILTTRGRLTKPYRDIFKKKKKRRK